MIYFVGAGPGAVDLITVRGYKLLCEADVIIYAGSLVNPELLKLTNSACQIYNSASMTLEEVMAVMLGSAEQLVVRLHTGDPSLYGAIQEQMDWLKREQVDYEVVPGVSSFCGAAAALKQEYTLPDVSQTVIITRMPGRTATPPREDIALLARHHASMVIFLSAGLLPELCERLLLSGGYQENTPAALVYKASWPDEQIVRGTVADLPQLAKAHGITKTALVLVGDFLSGQYERSRLYDPTFAHGFREAGQ